MSNKKITVIEIDQKTKIFDTEDDSPIIYIDVAKDDRETDLYAGSHDNTLQISERKLKEEKTIKVDIEKYDEDEKNSQDSFCSAEEVKINSEGFYGEPSQFFSNQPLEDQLHEDSGNSEDYCSSHTEKVEVYKEISKANHVKYYSEAAKEDKSTLEVKFDPENMYEEISKCDLTHESLKNHNKNLSQKELEEVKVDKDKVCFTATDTVDKTSITADKDENESSEGTTDSEDDLVQVNMQVFSDTDKKEHLTIEIPEDIEQKNPVSKQEKSWSEIFWTTGVDYLKLFSDVFTAGFVFWVILLIFYKGSTYTKRSLPGYHGQNEKYH